MADEGPWYSYETAETAWHATRDFIAPALVGQEVPDAADLWRRLARIRGHRMAIAGVEQALWDALARKAGLPLAKVLGATRTETPSGVSLGIQESPAKLVDLAARHVEQGYQRIKLKIAPGVDVERVAAVRAAHPDILLSVDANAAYTLADLDIFKALEDFNLLMIEQPLHYEDMLQHAKLQAQLGTDLCLDESIRSPADAAAAIELGACRIVNIKQGRVGGVLEARRVHDVAREAGVPVWCGGMLETGVGRALNLALASLVGFTLPGDTSASARYFTDDLTEPFVMAPDGTMGVPSRPGIGVEPRLDRLAETTLAVERLQP